MSDSYKEINLSLAFPAKKVSIPDVDDIAQKYDMELDEDDFSNDELERNESTEASAKKNEASPLRKGNQAIDSDMAKRMESLILKLDEKNKEIERLCVLLEALETVPGVNPEKLAQLVDGTDDVNVVCLSRML